MKTEDKNNWATRPLGKDEKMPYDLLLLADETIQAIDKYIFDGDIYVVEQDNKLIAVYVLCPLTKNEIEIKNIAVDKAYQEKGIGRFLLKDAGIRAKEKGYKVIFIGTADTATKQLKIYQKAGFEIVDKKKGFFTNNYARPIFEDGIQLRDMVMLRKTIQ